MIAYIGEYNLSDAKNNIIMHAELHWSDQSEPYSTQFNDVYFNNNQGVKESDYVFFEGNKLHERWSLYEHSQFCIIETGFGSGLNFFNTATHFSEFKKAHPQATLQQLHFISFEKYPLSVADLTKTVQKFPAFSGLLDALLQQYPLPVVGCHRLLFENDHIRLDLWFGDINEQILQLSTGNPNNTQIANAWYLDGFNPSSNPEMWQTSLFEKMYAYSKPDATLATFTAAGFVRRGLIAAGFSIHKRKGYGKKREMLIGSLAATKANSSHHAPITDIAIIGGGIASLCCALSLAKRGQKITLYCADKQLGEGASGNLQGALYPLINQQHDALSQLFTNAYLFALHRYKSQHLQTPFSHEFNGLLQLAYDQSSGKKLDKILAATLPEQLVHGVNAQQTNQLAGVEIDLPALYYPHAGWLSPRALIQSLARSLNALDNVSIRYQQRIDELQPQAEGWRLKHAQHHYQHQAVVIAAGFDTLKLQQCRALPLSAARGQVSHTPTTQPLSQLKKTLCHEGYITPALENVHCIGATFKRHDEQTDYRPSEQVQNIQKLQKCIPNKNWTRDIEPSTEAHVAIRCTTRDHFPYVGALIDYDDLKQQYASSAQPIQANALQHAYVLTGLGSRGLCTAPLLGEVIASMINHESLPISKAMAEKMKISRQWLNYIHKNKPLKD